MTWCVRCEDLEPGALIYAGVRIWNPDKEPEMPDRDEVVRVISLHDGGLWGTKYKDDIVLKVLDASGHERWWRYPRREWVECLDLEFQSSE